ncbi:type IV secretion system protein [Roseobacter weihaiensis]|uniref:type IV secretion system protein n=1 Tax=Roseobacter weihaiensis TaxID=2763262 RepID=UPI001D0A848A|nr:type IV secretion system protein [Roseobacter sp. H9]
MKNMLSIAALSAVLSAPLTGLPVYAQGIPVIDGSAIANARAEFTQEIAQMVAELEEARRLYDSVNGFTNMHEIADALNDPAVRELLGPDFMEVASSLTTPLDELGDLAGTAQDLADFTSITTEELNAEDFYRTELDRITENAARDGAVGDRILQSADERLAGLERLREELGNAETQKDMDALSGRIQIETAMLQNDANRISGLAMLQQAQNQLSDSRSTEATIQRWEENRAMWESEF